MLISWGSLDDAFGKAHDVPEFLRDAASADADVVIVAHEELEQRLFYAGDVFPATAAAVPFLAALARDAPHGRSALLWLLGAVADPAHADGDARPAIREAIAGQRPILVTLLADPASDVRAAAAYAATRAGVTAEALLERWHVEKVDTVRASLVLALGEIDPAGARERATTKGPPRVRLAAAFALMRAGQPLPDDVVRALVAAIDDDAELAGYWARDSDPLEILAHSTSPKARKLGLEAAANRCHDSRAAPEKMVPLFAAAAADPRVRKTAITELAAAGAAAARYADLLAEVAAGLPGSGGGYATAERAAANALGRLGDPRWVDPVCTAVAAGMDRWMLLPSPRRTPEALAAVRARLAAEPSRPGILPGVLGSWRAAEAVPELLGALPFAGVAVSSALLEIGYDHPAIAEHLAERVARSDPKAALAILRIIGDPQPLRELIRQVLIGKKNLRWRGLDLPGEAVRDLLPLAREGLTSEDPEIRMLAARVVAALDGPAAALPTVREVLAAGGTAAQAAAELAAGLAAAELADSAPADDALIALLKAKLTDPDCRLAAVRALARLGAPVAEMTEPLLAEFGRAGGHANGHPALAAIRELRAVDTVPALEEMAASDHRLPTLSTHDGRVWDDERLIEDIRATIAALS